jgi:acetyl esterase/lipase
MLRRTLLALVLLSPVFARGEVTLEKDIPFLEEGRPEKMDAYLPAARFGRPVPAVLMIHGGGWRQGDKAEERTAAICATLAENGYAVFSTNYKLNVGYRDDVNKLHLTEVAWPQNFADCKSAVRFLRREAKRFGIDPARIGVMGCSAGGHLALLVGATTGHGEMNKLGLYPEESSEVSCVVDFYGVADLKGKRITPFTGSDRKAAEALEPVASPVTYFSKSMPPVFIAHGTDDKVIPVEESRVLAEVLKGAGIEHVYVEIPGAPHSLTPKTDKWDVWPALLVFLEKHLGKPGVAGVNQEAAGIKVHP